jgi:hypothetical protein
MRILLWLSGISVGLSIQVGAAWAQIVPPFTSFTPNPPMQNFVTPMPPHPPHPHPQPPIIGAPFAFWGGVDYSPPPQQPPNVNVVVPPEPPPPPVVYNPPSSEITPSGTEVVRLMSTSPAR